MKNFDNSTVFLLFRIILTSLVFLYFFIKFKTFVSFSVKNCIEIFMGVALNLWTTFVQVVFFTVLILPIHKHRTDFPFLTVWPFLPECWNISQWPLSLALTSKKNCCCCTGDGNQGLVHTGQVLYHWTKPLTLEKFNINYRISVWLLGRVRNLLFCLSRKDFPPVLLSFP